MVPRLEDRPRAQRRAQAEARGLRWASTRERAPAWDQEAGGAADARQGPVSRPALKL